MWDVPNISHLAVYAATTSSDGRRRLAPLRPRSWRCTNRDKIDATSRVRRSLLRRAPCRTDAGSTSTGRRPAACRDGPTVRVGWRYQVLQLCRRRRVAYCDNRHFRRLMLSPSSSATGRSTAPGLRMPEPSPPDPQWVAVRQHPALLRPEVDLLRLLARNPPRPPGKEGHCAAWS